MLRMYFMDKKKCWEDLFPLSKFSYNNSYRISIKMAPFKFMYGRSCRTPLSWDIIEDRVLVGLEVIQEIEDEKD
jgi:hypothetical protein